MDRSSPAMSLYLRTVKDENVVWSNVGEVLLTPTRVAHLFSGDDPITVVTAVSDKVEALSGRKDLQRGQSWMAVLLGG